MKRYVVVNSNVDCPIYRVVDEAGYALGLVDAELEIKRPDQEQVVQWLDRCFVMNPAKDQLDAFAARVDEKVLDF